MKRMRMRVDISWLVTYYDRYRPIALAYSETADVWTCRRFYFDMPETVVRSVYL